MLKITLDFLHCLFKNFVNIWKTSQK